MKETRRIRLGFKVPADLADTDLTLTQVRNIVKIRKTARATQVKIDTLPAKKLALEQDLTLLRARERAIKAGEPDPTASQVDVQPETSP